MRLASCGGCVFQENEWCTRYPEYKSLSERPPSIQWCGDFKPKDGRGFRFPTEEMVTVSAAVRPDPQDAARGARPYDLVDHLRARARESFTAFKDPIPGWAHEDQCPLQTYGARKVTRSYPEAPDPPPPHCECETP